MLARPFTRGELLIEKGAFADRMYFLVSGQVAIEIDPEVRLHAGDYFGEIALMTPGTPRTANVRGIEDGVVVELTAHMCQRLSESFPSLMQPIRLLGQSRLDARKNRR